MCHCDVGARSDSFSLPEMRSEGEADRARHRECVWEQDGDAVTSLPPLTHIYTLSPLQL